MADEPDYLGLSKRFQNLVARASDLFLAMSDRKLAQTYLALHIWHENLGSVTSPSLTARRLRRREA